jgi:hypothetical protein
MCARIGICRRLVILFLYKSKILMIMKKKAILFAIAIMLAVTAGKMFANQTTDMSQKKETVTTNKPALLVNYMWYADPDLTYPVGTICDINAEMSRLRAIYPFNVFSSLPVGMVNPYEWGYYQYSNTAVIYSDLY